VVKIAASLLSADFLRLGEEIKAVEASGADMLHIDVMDGHFVPNITIGPSIVESLRKVTSLPFDVHLMIDRPDQFLDEFIRAGSDHITVHIEACIHLHRTIHYIRDKGVKALVSLNPATPLSFLDSILPDLDGVLMMSVNPGFGGQHFITQVLNKIRSLKTIISDRGLNALIAVDGGVKPDNAVEIAAAGSDILVMGSAFFHSGDYKALMSGLRERLAGSGECSGQ